jgi:hypothetical protein
LIRHRCTGAILEDRPKRELAVQGRGENSISRSREYRCAIEN